MGVPFYYNYMAKDENYYTETLNYLDRFGMRFLLTYKMEIPDR